MGTHFYHFAKSIQGNLIYQGKYRIEYLRNIQFGFTVLDTEIEKYEGNFLVDRKRTVKSGKTWLINHLKNKK